MMMFILKGIQFDLDRSQRNKQPIRLNYNGMGGKQKLILAHCLSQQSNLPLSNACRLSKRFV